MHQKQNGDIADIGQDVRWQKEVFTRLRDAPGAAEIVKRSDEFLDGLMRRKLRLDAFIPLTESLMGPYRAVAAKFGGALPMAVAAMEQAHQLAGRQKAHRQFLLALVDAAPR
jgi:hypothetical protein